MKINNLRIRFSSIYQKWQVITPYGAVLDEFSKEDSAIEFAKSVKDFLIRGK
jgi:hypothetical protein